MAEPQNVISCPQCGAEGPVLVQAVVYGTATVDSSLNVVDFFCDHPEQKLGDVDWEEDAEAACTACGHEGVISDFLKE